MYARMRRTVSAAGARCRRDEALAGREVQVEHRRLPHQLALARVEKLRAGPGLVGRLVLEKRVSR